MTTARFVSDGTEELVLQGSGPRPHTVWLEDLGRE